MICHTDHKSATTKHRITIKIVSATDGSENSFAIRERNLLSVGLISVIALPIETIVPTSDTSTTIG